MFNKFLIYLLLIFPLATIAQNTTYKNTQDGASFNENFIDVALIGDTLYMTLKEEGKIVKATDNTLSNSNATVSIADGNFEQALIDLGFDVFLDLKFHDIPNTVAKAVTAAAKMGLGMVNVHAPGGFEMMSKAKSALE